jgi:hypothetical protein
MIGARRRAQRDVPRPRRVAHGVLDEVHDDLVDALGIAIGLQRRGCVDREHDILGRVHARLAGGALEDVAQREGPHVERLLAGLQAREIEQLGDEPPEAARLLEHRAQRLGIGFADAVDDVLEHGLQRAERRAQLVRDVGDEVAPQAVGLGQLGRHPVKRPGELADLVVGRHRDLAAVLAARHRRRDRGHLAQRLRRAAGEQLRARQRERHPRAGADDRRQPEPAHGDDRRCGGDPDGCDDDDAELELQRAERPQRAHGAGDPPGVPKA